jgi:hypothetical protein
MHMKLAAAALLAATSFAAPASATIVGSASLATLRNCSAVTGADPCDGTGLGQSIATRSYGGGAGIAGWNTLASGANQAWSFVAFDATYDLPTIRAATRAPGDVRMNINVYAYQSYVWTGPVGGDFSISGDLHIVDSSVSGPDGPDPDGPGPLEPISGGAYPNGAIYSAYAAVWDPSIIAGLTTPEDLFNTLFYAPCGTSGVLGAQQIGGKLTGGEATYTATTSACSAGSLFLTPGQEVLVVVGLQLPVNRGGWADSSATFTTGLGKDLTPEQVQVVEQSIVSAVSSGAGVISAAAVPEPASWAMLIAGFGLTGAAMRRRGAGFARAVTGA